MPSEDEIRSRIMRAISDAPGKTSLKHLSVLLGRNPAYLQQYMKRRSPRVLPEGLRYRLAELLGIDPLELSSFDHDHDLALDHSHAPPGIARIAFIPHPSHDDIPGSGLSPCGFPASLLRKYGIRDFARLGMAVSGDDSAGRVIGRGDWVLVDTADRDAATAGYFALDMDKHIRIRHLEAMTASDPTLIVSHDGQNGYRMLVGAAAILGRVLCHFRMLSDKTT